MTANEQGHEKLTPQPRDIKRGQGLGGPFKLGDPEDRTLRKVEFDQLINKRMIYLADALCVEPAQALTACIAKTQMTSVLRCRSELKKSRECYKYWIEDERVKKTSIDDYLEDRSRYRRTGIQNFTSRKEQEEGLRKRAEVFAEKIREESTNDPF